MSSVNTYFCKNKCCKIFIKRYNPIPRYFKHSHRKAGVFIYDPKQKRVLLVQSRGHLFGPPKGSLDLGEREEDGAVREVLEETGLNISSKDFLGFVRIKNRAIYYYLEKDTCDIKVQETIENNDANGITWIKIDCLEELIKNGNIVLNHYAKIVFYKILNKTFPKSNWITVCRKKKSTKNL
jgi:8-oxo-dGTP pyrophosphatase MutT (NUDIX family)